MPADAVLISWFENHEGTAALWDALRDHTNL